MIKLLNEKAKPATEDNTPGKGLRNYIEDMKTLENDIASHVLFDDGTAHFWWDEKGFYTLVILDRDGYESTPEETKYWGDDELQNVNDIKLSAKELFAELKGLPGADLHNFYGMNNLIKGENRNRYLED